MDIDLALLADAATVDASGKLNILGVFDRIGSSSFPARHPRLSLVLRFTAGIQEAGRHHVDIYLRDEDGEEVVHLDGDMQLPPGSGGPGRPIRVPHVLDIDGLVFPRPGRYSFDVRVDGTHQVGVPLLVTDTGSRSAEA
jgi:hypothetical protein